MVNVKILKKPEDVLKEKPKKIINVIISVYDGVEYIEECLDSIQAQTLQPDAILLGIDGCQKTLKKVKQIRDKYDNLYVYYSSKNVGVYKMFNSLIDLVPEDEYIQIFGADDIMYPDMLEKMSSQGKHTISRHVGILFIQKKEIERVGGFRGWRCGADADMIYRLRLLYKYREVILSLLFHRRVHDKQLTKVYPATKGLRKKYYKITQDNYKSDKPIIYIKPIKTKLREI